MINVIDLPSTTHPNSPTDDNSWDEDRATYYGGSCGRCNWAAQTTHYFANTVRIAFITFYAETSAYIGYAQYGDGSATSECIVQYTTNGGSSWLDLDVVNLRCYSSISGSSGGPPVNDTVDTGDGTPFELSSPVNMNGIRVNMLGTANCSNVCTGEGSYGRTRDIRAWMQPYGYAHII